MNKFKKWYLINDNITADDKKNLVDFIMTDGVRFTQGNKVIEFEKQWSKWMGIKNSVFVNSGASANYIMASIMKEKKGLGEVIVPPIGWVSDISSLVNLGFTPVFVDISFKNMSITYENIKNAITDKTVGLTLIHTLGFNAMDNRILDLVKERNLFFIEDGCEAHGTTHNEQKIGTFGDLSNFSFYFGHHMSCTPSTPIPFLDKNGLFSIEPISEIYDNYKDKLSDIKILCFDKITKNIKYKTPSNVVRHNVGNKDLLSIKLRNGRAVEITEDHSVFRFGEDGAPEEVMGRDIQIGDKIVVPKYISNPPEISKINLLDFVKDTKNVFVLNYPKQNLRNIKCHWKSKMSKSKANYSTRKTIPIEFMTEFDENCKIGFGRQRKHNYIPCQIEITPAFARILGFFMAEGSYFDHGLTFSFNINEKDVVDSLIKDINCVFGLYSKIVLNEKDNGMSVKVYSKMLKHFFQEILKIKSGARNKRIPNIVFHFNEKCKAAYLYGHFTGDGTFDGIRLSVASASLNMINDISYLCSMMGLSGSVQEVNKPCDEKIIKNKKTSSFGVFCFRLYNIRFTEKGNIKIIDANRTSSYKKNKDSCGDLFALKVEKIQRIDKEIEHVYDFSVNNDENFIGGLQPICLHNSTIEGGMVCTNNDDLYQYTKLFRSHGLTRESSNKIQKKYIKEYPDLNPLFTFAVPGYNVRNTELNAVLGLSQLNRLDYNIKRRQENLKILVNYLDSDKFFTNFDLIGNSNFALPIILREKSKELLKKICKVLDENKIEYRLGTAGGGNQARQPYLKKYDFRAIKLYNADHIHDFSLYIGNHPELNEYQIISICNILNNL